MAFFELLQLSKIFNHAIRSDYTKRSAEEAKMPTARCTHLMARGMKWKLDEIWISEQPVLFFAYLTTYFPFVTRQLIKYFIGPGRVKALEVGGNIYDFKTVFGVGEK